MATTGLAEDLKQAFLKSMGRSAETDDPDSQKSIEKLGKDISKAIQKFLKAQTFTITEMKAYVDVEKIQTDGALEANLLGDAEAVVKGMSSAKIQVLPGIATPAGPTVSPGKAMVMRGRKAVEIPRLKLKKGGGQGGILTVKSYAYLGDESPGRNNSRRSSRMRSRTTRPRTSRVASSRRGGRSGRMGGSY